MTDAQLSAKIVLDTSQYDRGMKAVIDTSRQMEHQLNKNDDVIASNAIEILKAAQAAGLFADKMGRIHNNKGFATAIEKAAAGVRNLTKAELEATKAVTSLNGKFLQLKETGSTFNWHFLDRGWDKLNSSFNDLKNNFALGQLAGGAAATGLTAIGAAAKGAAAAFGAASVAATGFFAYLVKEAGDAKQLLADAARLNIDTTSLQQYQYAVRQVGIEQEKAADILKDVNDKIGDFIITGGGEAKDIFDKLGLSAQDFIGLSPDKALQKIADAAQGLSTQDKTFLFESIADDASLLIPLLDEAGAKMTQLQQQAVARGLILSQQELAALAEFKAGLQQLSERAVAFGQHLAAYMAKPLQVLLQYIDNIAQSWGGMDAAAMGFAEHLVEGMQQAIVFAADVYAWFQEWRIALIDVKAMVFSLLDGLMKGAEVLLKYTAVGQAADQASKIGGGPSMSEQLAQQRQMMQGVLDELSDERAKTEQAVAQAQVKAAELAQTLGKGMRDMLEQAKTDLAANQASGYAAKQPESDNRRSIDEYQQRMRQAAEQETVKSLQNLQRELDRVGLSAKELKLHELKQSGATDAQLAQASSLLDAIAAKEAAQQKIAEAGNIMTDAAQGMNAAADKMNGSSQDEAYARGRALIERDLAKLEAAAADYRRREDERMAQPQQVRYGAAASEQALQQQLAALRQSNDQAARLREAEFGRQAEAARLHNNAAQAQTEAAAAQMQAAHSLQAALAASQTPQTVPAAAPLSGMAQNVNGQGIQPAAASVNINLSGSVGINLSGNSDSLTQGIVSSEAFKDAFAKLFNQQLRQSLSDTARAVAA